MEGKITKIRLANEERISQIQVPCQLKHKH